VLGLRKRGYLYSIGSSWSTARSGDERSCRRDTVLIFGMRRLKASFTRWRRIKKRRVAVRLLASGELIMRNLSAGGYACHDLAAWKPVGSLMHQRLQRQRISLEHGTNLSLPQRRCFCLTDAVTIIRPSPLKIEYHERSAQELRSCHASAPHVVAQDERFW
jgi:hypothetical protein